MQNNANKGKKRESQMRNYVNKCEITRKSKALLINAWIRWKYAIWIQFSTRGSTQVLLCPFSGVLWLWHFLYSVIPHPVSSLHIYTFVVSRAFMAGAVSQAGDADSSRAPGLISGLQGPVNVHRGALLFVPQWQCISSFVFYINDLANLLNQYTSIIFIFIKSIFLFLWRT